MLTFVHPQITVRPMTRPGRVAYIGHDDFRLLVTDLKRALGPVEREQQRIRCEFTFRDGLLFTFDSYPAPKST